MKNDDFGDRMKAYEGSTDVRLNPALPICVRVDGRSFSTYTKNCIKPFDIRVSEAMRATARALVDETNAKIGFVQSDEITLILINEEGGSVFFDGRVQKLASVIASLAAVHFDRAFRAEKPPSFDCRVWQVPDRYEASNVVLWRAMDARRNGISSAFRAHFSAREMMHKKRDEMLDGMKAIGVDYFGDYAANDRLGTYYQRVTRPTEIPQEAWDAMHPDRRPEDRIAMRSSIEEISLPYFGDVANREGVIFDREEPRFRV